MGEVSNLWDHCDPERSAPKTIAVKLSAKGERSLRSHHPWIFDKNILKTSKKPHAGDVGVVFAHKTNKVIGVGLMDPDSPIALKLLHFDQGVQLDEAFFEGVLHRAVQKREPLRDVTNAMRLVFGENDGMPGLIVDQYDQVLVIKVYSLMWLPYLRQIQHILLRLVSPQAVFMRANRHVSKVLKINEQQLSLLTYGDVSNAEIEFHEYGVRFLAHVLQGHKTGFFLDHRYNRFKVGQMSSGKSVLDVFAYAGGFGVHALSNGAKRVTSIDISAQALELAQRNTALNEYSGVHETLCGDAFSLLQQLIERGVCYDIVVIDPPSFAKSAKGVDLALNKYESLARLGLQLVSKKGWLILASCSSRVAMNQFLAAHRQAFSTHKSIKFKLIETTEHDLDHAVGFEHGHYLKTAYYKHQ